MKIMTYNVMHGGVEPEPSRLEKVLGVIGEQDADVVGLQETKLTRGRNNALVYALCQSGAYPHDVVFDRDGRWTSGSALVSRPAPALSRIVGERVKAVEMRFQTLVGELSICNAYLSHLCEDKRVPEIKEVLEDLRGRDMSILMGDFNALSPEDSIPSSAVAHFSPRMKEKYCRDGKLCYDTIETVLEHGYIDVGLRFHTPGEITVRPDLQVGSHTLPVRIDFIFANDRALLFIHDFALVQEGTARIASDHFPFYVTVDDALFNKKSAGNNDTPHY